MLRKFSLCFIPAAALALGFAGAAQAESFTTRIEPRPFYGAVVTLEEGVRVIRALPPERQVIINPSNTPLVLGFNDTHVYERSDIYNYGSAGAGPSSELYGPYLGNGWGLNAGRGRFNGRFNGRFFGHPGFHHGVGGMR